MNKVKEQRLSLQMKKILTVLDNENEADRDFHLCEHGFGTINMIYYALDERCINGELNPTRKAAIYRSLRLMVDRGLLERTEHLDTNVMVGLPIKSHTWHIAGKVERDAELKAESRKRVKLNNFKKAESEGRAYATCEKAPPGVMDLTEDKESKLVVINPDVTVTPHKEWSEIGDVEYAVKADTSLAGNTVIKSDNELIDDKGITKQAYIDVGWDDDDFESEGIVFS